MSSRFTESQQPSPCAVVYMLMKKSLNYSFSSAEDDKLLPEGRQKKCPRGPELGTAKLSIIYPCGVKKDISLELCP